MTISNIYQIITVPLIIGFIFFFSDNPEVFLNLIIHQIINNLDLTINSKLIDNFFIGSFAKLNNSINFIFLPFFIFIISFCVYWFSNYNKNGVWLLLFAIILYPVFNIFIDAIWLRRFLFLILMIPIIPRIWFFFYFLSQ